MSGTSSQKQVILDLPTFLKRSNEIAMKFLSKSQLENCFHVLKKTEYIFLTHADSILQEQFKNDQSLHFLSITLNNLGCYYMSKNRVNAGLQYFKKAKDIEYATSEKESAKAVVNLNLSIGNLRIKNFKKALELAQRAENLVNTRTSNIKEKSGHSYYLKGLVSETSEFIIYTDTSLSPICCFYVGMNFENLEMFPEAYLAYKKGHDILKKLQERPGWEDKFLRKLISLKSKLKEEVPYISIEPPLKKPEKSFQRPAPRKQDESANTSIVEYESRPKRGHFFSKDRLKYKENLDIKSFQGFYKKEAQLDDSLDGSSPEKETKELKKTIVLLTFPASIKNRSPVPPDTYLKFKRIYGNPDDAHNKSDLSGYGYRSKKPSHPPSANALKITHKSFDIAQKHDLSFTEGINSKESTMTPAILVDNSILSNQHTIKVEKPKPPSQKNMLAQKLMRLNRVAQQNKSAKTTPRSSVNSSLEFESKPDYDFLFILTNKIRRRLNVMNEKQDDLGLLNKKIKESLDEIELDATY